MVRSLPGLVGLKGQRLGGPPSIVAGLPYLVWFSDTTGVNAGPVNVTVPSSALVAVWGPAMCGDQTNGGGAGGGGAALKRIPFLAPGAQLIINMPANLGNRGADYVTMPDPKTVIYPGGIVGAAPGGPGGAVGGAGGQGFGGDINRVGAQGGANGNNIGQAAQFGGPGGTTNGTSGGGGGRAGFTDLGVDAFMLAIRAASIATAQTGQGGPGGSNVSSLGGGGGGGNGSSTGFSNDGQVLILLFRL